MSGRDTPTPAEALALVRQALTSDESGRAAGTFMRGLTLGALLGAAIAGSAYWQRRERRRHAALEPVPSEQPSAARSGAPT